MFPYMRLQHLLETIILNYRWRPSLRARVMSAEGDIMIMHSSTLSAGALLLCRGACSKLTMGLWHGCECGMSFILGGV